MSEFVQTPSNVKVKRFQKDEAAQLMEAPQKGRAIRLYSQQSGRLWALQVRAPIGVGFSGAKDGKDFAIASAYMTRDDLIQLRNAIADALREV